MTVIQLTRDQAVTADRSVHELHVAAERAHADGRHRYANELDDLADQLALLVLSVLSNHHGDDTPPTWPRR